MQGSVLNAKFELLTIYSRGSKKSFRADIFSGTQHLYILHINIPMSGKSCPGK